MGWPRTGSWPGASRKSGWTRRSRPSSAVRGGYGSLKLLPHLDLAALAAAPKRLVGFSDLTNLLWDLHRRLKLVTFHGPNVAQLPDLTPAARENFYSWLTAPGPRAVTYQNLTVLHPGVAEGPLAGGNLTTLCHLVGTPYAPQMRGYLLFLEDHNEALYRLDRMLHHLLLAGVLDGVKGVVLGAFTNCGSRDGLLEVFTTALAPLKVPVLAWTCRWATSRTTTPCPWGPGPAWTPAAASLTLC